ncbi:S8 family peptidase [Tenacibaculum singaporense]|uniref:Peptidase n=1 Tax=Tenacibaculum singaporense TaxID=2358479 RepID=A0A3Q8RL06_9FLAO|nr:S8 family peptidase [Tenacibaculum singaporense]AZJ33994.1 peptidase [Tenacibaculum singaporense]
MQQFPHLNFSEKIVGRARYNGGPRPSQQTDDNKNNRTGHSSFLTGKTSNLKQSWVEHNKSRQEKNLAPLNPEIQPIFLQINPDLLADIQFDLENLNIEIISQEDNGFIVGASLDNLRTLEEKISGFIDSERGTGRIADLWQIIDGNREDWKPQHILSPELYEKWNEIDDNIDYHVEVSVAFDKPIKVSLNPDSTRYQSQLDKFNRLQEERDEKYFERENGFEQFIGHYKAELTSSIIDLGDSFACQVRISGKGLKDLVVNYPFVFEVAEVEQLETVTGSTSEETDFNLEIISPDNDAPEVGVIDSGIQENHRYIEQAIKTVNSKSYVDGDTSTSDKVPNGGHGTKVAGALLYPKGVSQLNSPYQLPFFIRNLRVLDSNNGLRNKFPADLLNRIIQDNPDCKIFNHSINSTQPFRLKHMSTWAAMLDTLTHYNDVLFICSVGNISRQIIKHYIQSNNQYPDYLEEPFCRVANPAQSSFSLVVGSVNHLDFNNDNWNTIGIKDEASAFSKIGTGIWGMIKPDVVEYGGAMQISKDGAILVSNKDTSIELIRSTLNGGSAYGQDSVGTSFATPKVSHIVAQLKKLYPNDGVNLLRALVVQGARLPNNHFLNPNATSIKHFGYGIPSLERVTENTEHRITFYNTNNIEAEQGQIYTLKIPDSLRGQGDDYNILVEVTLAYTAKVRRTRQKTKSYLSTWLEWKSSKINEPYNDFKEYVLKEIEQRETSYDRDTRSELSNFEWKIKNRTNGNVQGISRNNSTVQKDWAIIKSYNLPEEVSFAVLAHKGWDRQKEPVPYALTVSIEILGADIPIYEEIRLENEVEIQVNS